MKYAVFICILLVGTCDFANGAENTIKVAGFKSDSPIYDPDYSTFLKLVQKAELFDLFQGTGPYTVFVPSNAAFDKFGQRKINNLLKDKNRDELINLITYHIVPGEYLSKYMKSQSIKTINGKALEIKVMNGEITVNGAKVLKKDREGPNGALHEIDQVLSP